MFVLGAMFVLGWPSGCSSPGSTGVDVASPPEADRSPETSLPPETGATDTEPEGAPVDAAPETVAAACNPIQQDCPDDQNCTFAEAAKTQACVKAGTVAYGGDCTKEDCYRGTCLDINDTGAKCYQVCKTKAHCEDQSACVELSGVSYRVCDGPLEYLSCQLLADACPNGKGCYAAEEPTPVCLPAGTLGEGGVCEAVNDCAPGHACVNKRCYVLCDKTKGLEACPNFVPCADFWGQIGYCDA
jgi:hypothetical protein